MLQILAKEKGSPKKKNMDMHFLLCNFKNYLFWKTVSIIYCFRFQDSCLSMADGVL